MGKREKVSHGVCKGLPFLDDELMAASGALKARIVKVMARVSEASYRRGVQQGATFHKHIGGDLHRFRYDIPLDKAPRADVRGFPTIPGDPASADRLDIEHGWSLSDWGLMVERSEGRQVFSLADEKYSRRVRDIGREGLTDAEIIGGAFCDGLMNGVPPSKLHDAYMDSHGADQFEAAVWREIDAVKRKAKREG